jgi:hypothetical protein
MPAHARPGPVDRLHGKFTTCLLAIFVFLYWQIYRLTIGNSLYLYWSCRSQNGLFSSRCNLFAISAHGHKPN